MKTLASLPSIYAATVQPPQDDPRPRRLTAHRLMLALPGFFEQFKPLPEDREVKHRNRVLIDCPCGRRPILETGELVQCWKSRAWLNESGCETYYFAGVRGGYEA